MATIVDHQIRALCRNAGMVEPFNPDLLNPASIDVTLSDKITVELPDNEWHEVDISEDPYLLPPGGFIIASTAEWVRIPNNLDCIFKLKSSRGREGYNHMMAGYIDPGFHGNITLELHNCRQFNELPVFAGLKIGQLRFSTTDSRPLRPYSVTGRYHGDKGGQLSKG